MCGIFQLQLGLVVLGQPGQHAVEDVVISFLGHLVDNPGFLQKILLDFGSFDGALTVEHDVDVFAETRRVVVADGFGIAES